jgi:hypothetical protein
MPAGDPRLAGARLVAAAVSHRQRLTAGDPARERLFMLG